VVGYMPIADEQARRPGRAPSALYAREYERVCALYESQPEAILRHLWGGNVSLRRDDCRAIRVLSGSFDERYHEDQDFGIRCLKAGLEGIFDRSLLARHDHVRSVDGLLRDARNAGAGRVLVHRLHEDVLGPLDDEVFVSGVPLSVRWVVRLARRPRARVLTLSLLRRWVAIAGAVRLRSLEIRSVQLLRRIAFQTGAICGA
jgi:hypothetical protein